MRTVEVILKKTTALESSEKSVMWSQQNSNKLKVDLKVYDVVYYIQL